MKTLAAVTCVAICGCFVRAGPGACRAPFTNHSSRSSTRPYHCANAKLETLATFRTHGRSGVDSGRQERLPLFSDWLPQNVIYGWAPPVRVLCSVKRAGTGTDRTQPRQQET